MTCILQKTFQTCDGTENATHFFNFIFLYYYILYKEIIAYKCVTYNNGNKTTTINTNSTCRILNYLQYEYYLKCSQFSKINTEIHQNLQRFQNLQRIKSVTLTETQYFTTNRGEQNSAIS